MATLTSKNSFVGFTTVDSITTSQLADLALVEQDLRNHFFTRKNERVMMPGWGCGVWDYLFEPFDSSTKDSIIYEVQQVINSDPRVSIKSMDVTTYDQGIRVVMNLYYVPFNAIGTFNIDFDKRSQQLS